MYLVGSNVGIVLRSGGMCALESMQHRRVDRFAWAIASTRTHTHTYTHTNARAHAHTPATWDVVEILRSRTKTGEATKAMHLPT